MPSIPLVDRLEYLRFLNDLLIGYWVRFLLLRLHFKKPVLWYYEPRYSSLIGKLNERMVVYDCADDRMEFAGVPQWIKEYLELLINKAQIIFATSDNLYNKMRQYGKDNVYMVGNGVDVDHFKKAMSNIPIPEDIKMLKKPIIGYFGVIDQWLDLELIKKLASAYPNSSILLIGPIMLMPCEELNELKKCQNVFFIGKRPYNLLPSYLKAFDVCIIPFKMNELTKSVNPVKLYEYLAGWKNVVSTALPEINKYNDLVYIAQDYDDFIHKLNLALSSDIQSYQTNTVLNENAWDTKVKNIIKILKT
jgi:glycosyltransferase involved in cell wall biosynthesis